MKAQDVKCLFSRNYCKPVNLVTVKYIEAKFAIIKRRLIFPGMQYVASGSFRIKWSSSCVGTVSDLAYSVIFYNMTRSAKSEAMGTQTLDQYDQMIWIDPNISMNILTMWYDG